MTEFPSPIGVLYISISICIFPWIIGGIVSVPYWGSLYFNDNKGNVHGEATWFPSPIGVLYISISY